MQAYQTDQNSLFFTIMYSACSVSNFTYARQQDKYTYYAEREKAVERPDENAKQLCKRSRLLIATSRERGRLRGVRELSGTVNIQNSAEEVWAPNVH
ncbi:hypothetical protein M513_02151 [Trichuris suis]|uniref:Uncharacterized protein n=1 Tax=Trichuris suis TaxID=68888 RepID=A0A085MI48_9BILA|nr:hypothetical protein M513_02151 [Trichuris suis]